MLPLELPSRGHLAIFAYAFYSHAWVNVDVFFCESIDKSKQDFERGIVEKYISIFLARKFTKFN